MIHDASRRRVQSARPTTIAGQRDRRDHQLQPGEEHARAQDGEQDVRIAARQAFHRAECRRAPENAPAVAD